MSGFSFSLSVDEFGLLQLTGKHIVEKAHLLDLEIRETGPNQWEITRSGYKTLTGSKADNPADLLRLVITAIELHTKPGRHKIERTTLLEKPE